MNTYTTNHIFFTDDGTFAKYRVFESYAWMHSIYAAFNNPTMVNGNFYDAVIPGYIEPEMFPLQEKKED